MSASSLKYTRVIFRTSSSVRTQATCFSQQAYKPRILFGGAMSVSTFKRPTAVQTEDEYNDVENKDPIRWQIKNRQLLQWGFPVVRCTYSSQARWDEYISRMRADIDKYLGFDTDADLRSTLKIPIIEDVDRLDGATWKQARARYDEWVWEDLKEKPNFDPSWDPSKQEEKVAHMITRSPHLEFFIFADKASVDSVVDCVDIEAHGAYFFTLVATALRRTRVFSVDENGNDIKDDEDDKEVKLALWQTFKLHELVGVYSSCADDFWPNCFLRGADGISRLL